MDFQDSPEEAAFRAECAGWLAENAPAKVTGEGPASLFGEEAESGTEDAYIRRAKAWQAAKFDAGYAAITWPKEFGGREGTPMQSIIFNQEQSHYDVPTTPYIIGLGMVAPTIRTHGTPAQRERYLEKMLRGEEIWCQLFSEPGAGSDVASLSTLAVRDGDEYVLTGQKVWTSGAQYSDFGEIICRTEADAPKHRGITAFIVDMKAPGVTVRPLRQMTGGASFNEVFFDEVRVPADQMLGELNKGWGVAITTLMNERVTIGSGGGAGGSSARFVDLARRRGLAGDANVRQRIAQLHIHTRIPKYNGWRTLTAVSNGGVPGPEGSIGKLFGGETLTLIAELSMQLVGASGIADAGDGLFDWNQIVLGNPGMHLAGGTDEVMKNIIGERVLGLPGEPRVDKDVAWKDIPK